jgi:hypothetical protein
MPPPRASQRIDGESLPECKERRLFRDCRSGLSELTGRACCRMALFLEQVCNGAADNVVVEVGQVEC